MWVVLGRFLLVVGRFRSFLVRCMSFQIVADRFRSFQVVPRFSKYRKKPKLKMTVAFFVSVFFVTFYFCLVAKSISQ